MKFRSDHRHCHLLYRARVLFIQLLFKICACTLSVLHFQVASANNTTIEVPVRTIKILPTDDVTVIGWINGNSIVVPNGANPNLVSDLQSAIECALTLRRWKGGEKTDLFSVVDVEYANAILIKNSANHPPPANINPDTQKADGDYRAFSRLQASISSKDDAIVGTPRFIKSESILGNTPEPCTGFQIIHPSPEPHPDNGVKGINAAGTEVFQLTEGRLGPDGQLVNQTLNGSTTPWIWSVTQFNNKGQLDLFSSLSTGKTARQIFPTYSVYVNGQIKATIPQGDLQAFIGLNDSSQIVKTDP